MTITENVARDAAYAASTQKRLRLLAAERARRAEHRDFQGTVDVAETIQSVLDALTRPQIEQLVMLSVVASIRPPLEVSIVPAPVDDPVRVLAGEIRDYLLVEHRQRGAHDQLGHNRSCLGCQLQGRICEALGDGRTLDEALADWPKSDG